jgi:hypothetical protein
MPVQCLRAILLPVLTKAWFRCLISAQNFGIEIV